MTHEGTTKSLQENTEGVGLLATRLFPLDSQWGFDGTFAVIEISAKVFVEHAHVKVHVAEHRTFYVYSLVPPGAVAGIHSVKVRRIDQTPGLQLLHPIVSNDAQLPILAILGNGTETVSHQVVNTEWPTRTSGP